MELRAVDWDMNVRGTRLFRWLAFVSGLSVIVLAGCMDWGLPHIPADAGRDGDTDVEDGDADGDADAGTDADGDGDVCPGGCEAPLECCGGQCVDLASDPDNCGACGHACTQGVDCDRGECICPYGATPEACSPGMTCCDHTVPAYAGCVDTNANNMHCGGCNLECFGQCIDGACVSR